MAMDAADLVVDAHAPEVELYAAIGQACRQLLPGWACDQPVHVEMVSGGISNALFKCSCGPLAPVAFRIYGDNTEKFIDRAKELGIMRLVHAHGFGPQVLATFANGRIEEFLPMRSLKPEEMDSPQFVPDIAAALQRFHSMPAQGKVEGRTPFGRIREWLDIAEQFAFDDPQKQALFAAFDFAALRGEVQQVEAAAGRADSPLVFAHNDLLSGNIMVSSSSGDSEPRPQGAAAADDSSGEQQQGRPMTFIDFEYADLAPRGFDWGNHFCEYAGFDCDYTRYPQHQQAALFIEHYLRAGGSTTVDAATLRRCVAEANVYALASHQYWGTWSLLQAKWSKIDFDYLSYAKLRWDEYSRRKDEFLAAAAAAFAGP